MNCLTILQNKELNLIMKIQAQKVCSKNYFKAFKIRLCLNLKVYFLMNQNQKIMNQFKLPHLDKKLMLKQTLTIQ